MEAAEDTIAIQVETTEETSTAIQVEATEETAAAIQVEAAEETAAAIQVEATEETAATIQVEAAEKNFFSETCDARALPLVGRRSESVRKERSRGGVASGCNAAC